MVWCIVSMPLAFGIVPGGFLNVDVGHGGRQQILTSLEIDEQVTREYTRDDMC